MVTLAAPNLGYFKVAFTLQCIKRRSALQCIKRRKGLFTLLHFLRASVADSCVFTGR